MIISPLNSIFVIVLLSSVLILVTAAGITLALKYKQYRSRPYLFSCCCFLFQSLGIAGILTRTILNGRINAHFDSILRPASLITGFLTLFCVLVYVLEIKRPGKLSLKSILFCISPFIITSIILILIHPGQIHSLEDVFNGIKRSDVWLRLVIVFFYFAYPFAVACQRYEWRQCMISRNMIVGLQILSFIIAPAFIAGLSCGYFPAIVINYITAIVLDALVVYIEFKIRIPADFSKLYKFSQKQKESTLEQWDGDSLFDNPKIWMNPDMTATELVRIMGTNHTYLLKRIKSLGYSNYSDMINRKRVEYICKEMEKGTNGNIINLMFEAGFRSRSTASREFKRIVGCTPSEYQESVVFRERFQLH